MRFETQIPNLTITGPHSRIRMAWAVLLSTLLAWGLLAWAQTLAWNPAAGPGPVPVALAQAPEGGTPPAPVGGTAAVEPEKSSGTSVLGHVASAGWIGVIIIICSIVGFALAITCAFQLRRDSLVPPEVVGQVEQCFEEENYEEAFHVCEGNPSFFSAILASGLAKVEQGYVEIEGAMAETGDLESNKLHQKVGYLSLIASIAPMLGLFGTVYGMIKTFSVIANSATQPSPQDLAGGISLALVTTFMGLLVAIPMTVLFVFFRNKVVSTVLEVGALSEELMSRFKPQPQ